MSKGGPQAHSRDMLTYVAGNACALLVGLLVAYWALALRTNGGGAVMNIRVVDLMEYFSAARLILEGHGGALYDVAVIGHEQARLIGTSTAGFGVLPYFYPPYFVLALAPLALLPYTVAYLLWLALNCALLALCMYALEGYAQLTGRAALAFRGAAFVFLPVFMSVGLGQASLVLLALFCAAFFTLRRGHLALAGALFAAASLKPAYVAPILLVLVLGRHWRAIAGYAGATIALFAVTVPFLGPRIVLSYLGALRLTSGWQGRSIHRPLWYHHVAIAPATYAAQWNHSLAGFTELLLGSRPAFLLYAVLALPAILLLAHCALHSDSIEGPLAIAVILGLLISPHTLAYDLTLLLLPAAHALRHRRLGPPGLPLLLGTGYIAVLVGYKLSFFVPIQLSVIAMSALALWLYVAFLRSEQTSATARPVHRVRVA